MAWVELGQSILAYAAGGETTDHAGNLGTLLERLVSHGGLSVGTAEYLTRRAVTLAPTATSPVINHVPGFTLCACGQPLDPTTGICRLLDPARV